MKRNSNFILLVAALLAVLLCLVVYYFNMKRNENIDNDSTTNNTVVEDNKIKTNEVTDYNDYFTVNYLINEYYNYLEINDYDKVLNILDSEYKILNNIDGSNIKNYIKNPYDNYTYYAMDMYYFTNGNLLYFIVKGDLQEYMIDDGVINTEENISYVVIINKIDKLFSIMPITEKEYNTDIKGYSVTDKTLSKNDNNTYEYLSYDDNKVAILYIGYYKNLLYIDTTKAYSMLSKESKNTYPTLEDFTNDLNNIYKSLTTNIIGVKDASGSDGNKTYRVMCSYDRTVKFTENSIMNFEVTLN